MALKNCGQELIEKRCISLNIICSDLTPEYAGEHYGLADRHRTPGRHSSRTSFFGREY